jgi:hypothetical protein
LTSSAEYEGVVGKLFSREALCVEHELVGFNIEGARALLGAAAHSPKLVAIRAAATANRLILRMWILHTSSA